VPVNLNTLLSLLDFGLDDEPLLSDEKVAYRGEPVAAVIAETEAQARAAVPPCAVEWECCPMCSTSRRRSSPARPAVNPTSIRTTTPSSITASTTTRSCATAMSTARWPQADHVVEGRYQMSPIEQAPIETCGAIAAPEQNDRYVCYTGTQALFFSLGTAAKVLNMPSSRLHFIGGTVGGGFGGKVDSIHEPLAILGAMLTGRPVKYASGTARRRCRSARRAGPSAGTSPTG
jgi:CO/xanthine dehydrogenase Mo-binding subunit